MNKNMIQVYYGNGQGKSNAAIGKAIHAASEGASVVIIQFLKAKNENEIRFLNRLEPEIKFFRFAKSDIGFEELSEEEKQEEIMNLKNGFHYSRKVIATEACDLIVLDEVLGLLDLGLISVEELIQVLEAKPEGMTIICTGRVMKDEIRPYVDDINKIDAEK